MPSARYTEASSLQFTVTTPPPKNIDDIDGARGIVEKLFFMSLIALVGTADRPSSSPRKL
jgi:hypothetical protein